MGDSDSAEREDSPQQRRRKKKNPGAPLEDASVDLGGKVVLVLGGDSGVGREVAKDCARRKATVVVACKDSEAGEKAVDELREATDHGSVFFLRCDLASLEAVEEAVDKFKMRFKGCFAVVFAFYKAGYDLKRRLETRDGHEVLFQVNALAPLRVVHDLMGVMAAGGEGRVVFVSRRKRMDRVHMRDLRLEHHWSRAKAIGQARVSLYCFMSQLSRMVPAGIVVNMVDPCARAADNQRGTPALHRLSAAGRGRSDAEIADTVMRLVAEKKLVKTNGKIFKDGVLVEAPSGRSVTDPAYFGRVYRECCRMIGAGETSIRSGEDPEDAPHNRIALWCWQAQKDMGVEGTVSRVEGQGGDDHSDEESLPEGLMSPEQREARRRQKEQEQQAAQNAKGRKKKR